MPVMKPEKDESRDDKRQTDGVERRILPPGEIELRVDGDDQPRLVGYAAKYGILTDLGWFREKIKSGAFDDAVKDGDVRCLKNHDPNLILGRTKSGTLRLTTNTVGLRFEDDVPETNTGRDTLEEVRRGDISGCSFAFTVAEEDWKYLEDDIPERTIIKIGQLFDVGPVTYPAYTDTTVAARSLEQFRSDKPGKPDESDSPDESDKSDKSDKSDESDKPDGNNEISPERIRKINRGYREAGRILKYLKPLLENGPADVRPVAPDRRSGAGDAVGESS